MRLGRDGRSSQVEASRYQRAAVDDSRNRSAATVGVQHGPGLSGGSGSGIPLAIRPAAAATSRTKPSRCSSTPVSLLSRLASRTPSPPLRNSGTGAAERVSSTTSVSRIKSITAPAAAASTSLAVVPDTTGSGGTRWVGPGSSPRSTWPTRRGRITVSASICRSRPAASSLGTGRSGGVPGAASRVRPIGEPTSSRSSSSRWGSSSSSTAAAISDAGRSASSRMTWPGYQGSAEDASAGTRTAVSPHTSARSRRSSSAPSTASRGARSPIRATSLVTGTPVASACRTSSASITASRRKSNSSVAALTDCRATARAARAAMLPGAGWARSGRSSSRWMRRSSGNSASQAPNGTGAGSPAAPPLRFG